jgi:hypothetical protein
MALAVHTCIVANYLYLGFAPRMIVDLDLRIPSIISEQGYCYVVSDDIVMETRLDILTSSSSTLICLGVSC